MYCGEGLTQCTRRLQDRLLSAQSDSVLLTFQETCSLLLWGSSFRASGSSYRPEFHDPEGQCQHGKSQAGLRERA